MSEKIKKPEHRINRARLSKYVLKAQKNNKKAMEYIVNETSDYIYYYCLTLLCDEEKALEAVQDIYLILLQKINSLQDADSFLGWLKVITSNYCKDKLIRSREELSLESVDYVLTDEDIQLNPEKSLETDELCQSIILAIHSLPDSQKECILMYYYQDMSVSQIATVLEIKEGTVKSRLFNARKAIKSELKKFGIDKDSLGGISPLSYVAYSMISDSEKSPKPNIAGFSFEKVDVSVKSFDSSPSLTSVATGLAATTKVVSTPIKIAIIATAGTFVIGGGIAHTATHLNSESTLTPESVIETVEETQPTTSEEDLISYLNRFSFSEEDLRKELYFDETEGNLNSENNKKYIFDRMNNSIDYFDTLQGSMRCELMSKKWYIVFYIDKINNQYKELVYDYSNFSWNLDETQYMYPYSYYCRNSNNLEIDWEFNESEREEMKLEFNPPYSNPDDLPTLKIQELATQTLAEQMKLNDKERVTQLVNYTDDNDYLKYIDSVSRFKDTNPYASIRKDYIHLPISHLAYFPYALVWNYGFADFDNWNIIKNGVEKNTVQLEYSSVNGDFRVNVNKKTGVVELCDYEDIFVISAEMVYDEPIDQSVFDDLEDL